MKKYGIICAVVLIVGLLGTFIGLSLMPDTVPVHFGFDGQANRWGSKYELLITPAAALLMGGAFLFAAWKQDETKKEGALARTIFAVTAIFEMAFFFGLTWWMLYTCGRAADAAVGPAVDAGALIKGCGVFIGLTLIVLGNFMPKAQRNAFYGLRVPWTMDSEAVWQRSQRFSGIAAVAAGILTTALALALPGLWAIAGVIVVPLVWVVLSLIMSWKYHKEDQKR